jgi:DtxR family transcriptional regulator, manganese transport regulator
MIAELIDKTGEARLTDLARGLSVTHVTANRTIKRLQRKGLVTSQPYRSIFLTTDGRSLAKESRDRHETVVRFLMALGVPAAVAESDAEGIEHHVSRETLAAFVRHLGNAARRGALRVPSKKNRQSEHHEQRADDGAEAPLRNLRKQALSEDRAKHHTDNRDGDDPR